MNLGALFNLDGPLMRFLSKLADLMIINLLTLILCIPVVTAGAALTSLHCIALKIVRGDDYSVFKDYFRSFKSNFRQATIIWIILLVAVAVMVGDYLVFTKSGIEFHDAFKIIVMVLAVLVIFTAVYVFPVLARFENTVLKTLMNAMIMSLLQLPKTLIMIILYILPVAIAYYFLQILPLLFLFGLSGPAWLSALLYNRFFRKLEDAVEAAAQKEEAASEETGSEEKENIPDGIETSEVTEENEISDKDMTEETEKTE